MAFENGPPRDDSAASPTGLPGVADRTAVPENVSMLQQFREDVRDYPATMVLGALWVVVFVLMVWYQSTLPSGLSLPQLILGLRGGHRFGDMTLNELFAGEVWRTVTATFVHYGLLHIGMNIYALYHLGCLVESWYGSGPFVAIYVITGGLGNLLSGLVRHALHWDPNMPSGGGSVVVMGLVGLCAVVGWRARTRLGDYLRNQMVWVLVLTAAIGLILPFFGLPIIDNWGHACGALMGAAVGLGNGPLTRHAGRPAAGWAGFLGTLVLVASALAQVADDQAEVEQRRQGEQARVRWEEEGLLLVQLDQIRDLYRTVALPNVITRGAIVKAVPPRPAPKAADGTKPTPSSNAAVIQDTEHQLYSDVVSAAHRALVSLAPRVDAVGDSENYRRLCDLLVATRRDPPTLDELREFNERMGQLRLDVARERDRLRNQALSGLIADQYRISAPTLPPQVQPIPLPGPISAEPVNPPGR
ncbi:MAG: rhomboid family intramembrane serine protease [Isosphaeraceae bacterium]